MSDANKKIGKALRFIASGGMANEDPDVVTELLQQAHQMATMIVADDGASSELRALAQSFLDRLRTDTLGEYGA